MFLGYLWNPLSWAMEAAALLAIILLDYADFCLIIALLLVNATIRCLRACSLQHQQASVHLPHSLPHSCGNPAILSVGQRVLF